MNRRCGALGRLLLIVGAVVTGLLVFAGVASAATYTVNTPIDSTDSGSCATTCSLRDALTAVNAVGGTNTIVVPAGSYILTQGQLPQINNTNLTLTGAGARSTTINGAHASRIFDFTGGMIAISGITITDGFNNDTSGGLPADSGGAIHDSASALMLTDMAVTDSEYVGDGGGGAIAADAGTLTLNRVTLSGNKASGDGGGLYQTFGPETTTIIDSTIADNEVDASLNPNVPLSSAAEVGGGIDIEAGTVQLINSTVADNSLATGAAVLMGGGIFHQDQNSAAPQAANTIVAENSPDDCAAFTGASPPVTSIAPNLDSDSTCFSGASDQHANPLLQSLSPNGGQTDTLALGGSSPAIDAGQNSTCPATDQRGISRPQGATCDLGAYEATAPLVQTGTATAVGTDTATIGGTANPDDQSGFAYFQYGTSTAYGFATPGSYIGSVYGEQALTSDLAGLAPNTTYHFRIVGVSAVGTNYGADQTFTTAAPPPTAPTTTPTTPTATTPPKCSIRLVSQKVPLSAPKLRVRIVCNQAAAIQLKAVVGETLPAKPAWHRAFSLSARKTGTALTFTLKLPRAAVTDLKRHLRETIQLTLVAHDANGTTTQRTQTVRLRPESASR